MKILIAGDFFVSDQYYNSYIIDTSVQDLFYTADYRIMNLEAPITIDSTENRIIKTGPHLRMSKQAALSISSQLNINGVTLANNHILDYDTKGLLDTLETLKKNKITYVGAGVNLKDAAKYITLNKDGMKIGIINFCENEWSIAEEEVPGANPMDTIENSNQIREAKASHDKVIVIVHGGHEYYNLPSPRMQKQYRFYADQGADIVIGHHTHCISGYEVYKSVPIYYSLGNFLFTKNSLNEDWYTGLILEVEITNEDIKCKIHPIRQEKESFKLRVLEGDDKNEVLERIDNYSSIIVDDNKLDTKWNEFISNQIRMYLHYWSPTYLINNRYIRAIIKKACGPLLKKRVISLYLNLIRCESHRDISIKLFKQILNN